MPAVSTLSSSGARRSSSVASGDRNKPSEEVIRALVQRNVSEVKSSFLVFKSQVRGLLEAQSRVALDLERQLGARLLRSEQERLIGHLSSGDEYLKFVSEKQLELNPSAAAAARHLATTTSTSSAENKKVFFFDRIFAPDRADANTELYAAVSEEILAAFDGQNVALIAYGATGTGKTYSCNSIMERAIKEIDSMWKRASAAGERMDIEAQLVEVYNESIQDLLGCGAGGSASSGSGGAPAGSASTTAVGGLKVQDVTLSVSAGGEAAAGRGGAATITRTEVVGARKLKLDNSRIQSSLAHILKLGHENRATFATNVHEHSSRTSKGHLQLLKCGKLSFVDLAGSERVKKSDVSGDRLKEAQYINKSLSALQDVIWAHERKIAHIPYRNSKLTHLLQDSLGNRHRQSRTVILVTLSPAAAHVKESLQTLQFGSRLNSVNFSAASKRGAESVEQNRLKGILQEERKEKTMVKNAAEKLRREAEVKEIALREKDDMIAALKEQLENALKGRPKGSLNFTTPLQFTARGSGSAEAKSGSPVLQPKFVSPAMGGAGLGLPPGGALGGCYLSSPQFHFYHGTTPAGGTAPMSPILADGFHTARGAFSSGIGAPGASPSASPQSHQGAARTSGQQPPQADGFFTARDPLPVKTPIRGQTSSVARSSISSASATRRTPQQPRYYQVEAISSQEARELVKEWGREGEAADGDGSPPLVLKEAPDVGREHLTFDHLEPEDQNGGAACSHDGLVLEPQEELEETPGGNNGRSSTSRRTIPSGASAGGGDGKQMRTVNLLDAGAPYGDRDDDMDAVSLSSTESDIKERLQFLLDIDPRSKADDSRTSDASCRPEQEVDRNSGCTGSGAVDYEVGKLHAQRGHPVQVAASPLGHHGGATATTAAAAFYNFGTGAGTGASTGVTPGSRTETPSGNVIGTTGGNNTPTPLFGAYPKIHVPGFSQLNYAPRVPQTARTTWK
eukprot:g16378.t1